MQKSKNILVTGSGGQLGSEIQELAPLYPSKEVKFYFMSSKNLDITNHERMREFCRIHAIDCIINCAAYTAVDNAESQIDKANEINHLALRNIAQIAKEQGSNLIHISTDYVFDGKNYKPYTEEDCAAPRCVYGKTKLDGERAIQEVNPANALIIRTSWLYSSYGVNFVKTILRLAREKSELGVVCDQVGTPTYALDLAKFIFELLLSDTYLAQNGVHIYHYSNEGVLSWYDFAKEIMCITKLPCKILPIQTSEYKTAAQRPHYSLLNKSKVKKDFKVKIPYWKDSLECCLMKMNERR